MIANATPTAVDTPPAAATPSSGASTDSQSSGFDAILTLQGLAGTAETLESTLEGEDLLAGDDDSDEDTDEDAEASLAFLANLIAVANPSGSSDEFDSDTGGRGARGEGGGVLPIALTADAGLALAGDAGETESDAVKRLGALAAESLESRQSSGDASQNLARAVELLSQSPRGMVDKLPLTTPVHSPRWADDFGARISLMVRGGESTASLQLTPVDLGPVEVSVSVKDSQATIHFGASQAETRALIEASLPKLRELLASQGFNLLDASVSSGFSRPKQPAFATSGPGAAEVEAPLTEVRTIHANGLLDLYA